MPLKVGVAAVVSVVVVVKLFFSDVVRAVVGNHPTLSYVDMIYS